MNRSRYSYLSSQLSDDAPVEERAAGISKDLEKLSFSPTIKYEANALYCKMQLGQKRGRTRKMAVAFCLYQVILNRGDYYDIVHIGKLIDLAEDHANEAISAYTKILGRIGITGENHHGIIDPVAMINYYCGDSALRFESEQIEDVLNIYNKVKDNFDELSCSKKTFVASIIYFWIKRNGLSFNPTLFLRVFPGVAENKLKVIYNTLYTKLIIDCDNITTPEK